MKIKTLVLTGTLVSLIGCSTPNYRSGLQHRNARSVANCTLKGTSACPLANKNIAKRGERQSWGKEFNASRPWDGVRKRMGEAVKSGKLTKEKARERFSEHPRKMKEDSGNNNKNHFNKGKKDGTKSRSTKNRQQ